MVEFDGCPFYSCSNCRNPIVRRDDIISRQFRVKSGAAYMFKNAINLVVGRTEERELMTGVHTVASTYCSSCDEEMGWKYIRAYEPNQRYKEGHFVIDRSKIMKEN